MEGQLAFNTLTHPSPCSRPRRPLRGLEGGGDVQGLGDRRELTGQKGPAEAWLPAGSRQLPGQPQTTARAATHHLVQALKSMPVWACAQRMAVRTSTCGSPLGSRPSREGDHSPPTNTTSSSFWPSKNCKKRPGVRNEKPITWVSHREATCRRWGTKGLPHWGWEGYLYP